MFGAVFHHGNSHEAEHQSHRHRDLAHDPKHHDAHHQHSSVVHHNNSTVLHQRSSQEEHLRNSTDVHQRSSTDHYCSSSQESQRSRSQERQAHSREPSREHQALSREPSKEHRLAPGQGRNEFASTRQLGGASRGNLQTKDVFREKSRLGQWAMKAASSSTPGLDARELTGASGVSEIFLQNGASTTRFNDEAACWEKGSEHSRSSGGSERAHAAVGPKIAAGRVAGIIAQMEQIGNVRLENSSVYGTAVALPQIARSTQWSGTFMALAIRSYMFLALNIILQGFVLSMIGIEQLVIYPFAGQMHLCDFGSQIRRCHTDSDAANCRGPGGTKFSYPRLYGYDIWSTRVFVRESLKTLFPDRAEEIMSSVDPGEYGIESYWCRMACIFIFMMAVVDDLRSTFGLMQLIFTVPSNDDVWLCYEHDPTFEEDDDGADPTRELENVRFQVAGMPFVWKLINLFVVVIPKVGIWLALAASGVHYLMETAAIVDMVVNAMALTFVLDLDELIFCRLTTEVTKHIMSRLEGMDLYDPSALQESDAEVLERFQKEELGWGRLKKLGLVFPRRLMHIILMQAGFMGWYYSRNCVFDENGGLVSKPMQVPKDLSFNPVGLMFGIEPSLKAEPFWTMPEQ